MNSMTRQRKGEPAPVNGGHQVALAAFRGHRFAEGEGGAAPTSGEGAPPVNGDQQAASAAATPPATPPAPSPATVAAQQQASAPKPGEETFSKTYVHELREEAKANRVAHQAEQAAREKAESEAAEAKAQIATYQRESAVRAAAEGIGNAALLLDSASFIQSIAQVDPADPAAVKAAITSFVEKNSAYAATPTLPGSSGGTPSGGTNQTPTTLEGAIAAHLSK